MRVVSEMADVTSIDQVTVVGGGTMGHGIAQTFAQAGYDVTIDDVDEEILASAIDSIDESLRSLGVDNPDEVLNRIETTTNNEVAFEEADLVVEAVPEDIEIKSDIFDSADSITSDDTILATNTSTLPITEIASVTDHPERVVGMHFSSPVQKMPIVEIIRGEATSDSVFEMVETVGKDIGKTPILVEKDVPGFVINRLNLRFWLEAVRQVDEEGQDKKTIDAAIRRLGFPMGPFEVMDFAGVDVLEMAARSMQERDVDVHIPQSLADTVDAGNFGMKTGKGFYDYPTAGGYSRVDIPRELRYDFDPKKLIAPAVNEAIWLLENDVTTKAEIDEAVQIGMNWPRGLLQIADEYGLDRLLDTLESLEDRSDWNEYQPHPKFREMVENEQLGQATGEGFYEYEYEKTEFDTVEFERREDIAWITINRPDNLNALDRTTWEGLISALEQAASDDQVRATILRGAGRAFSAGDDIGEMLGWESTEDATTMVEETMKPAIETLREHPKPLIAAVDGIANGGGCELVMLTDLAVASNGSDFALPEARIGALPPIALTYGTLSSGKKAIMELALTGDQISATRAEEMGIVNYSVSGSQVEDIARELATKTKASAPGSLEAIAKLWVDVGDDLLDEWIEAGLDTLITRTQSEEAKEGLQAFVQDESPSWNS